MCRKLLIPALMILVIVLAACSAPATPSPVADTLAPGDSTPAAAGDLTRADEQGSVTFSITPLNLIAPGETLDFNVAMETHSVELSWNLAAQAELATDTGLTVKGLSWPVSSGHHVEGKLTFPAKTADGKALLEGAKTLTLTIRDADAPIRTFEWEVAPAK